MRARIQEDPNILEGGYTKIEAATIRYVAAILTATPIEKLKPGVEKRIVKTAAGMAGLTFDDLERPPEKKRRQEVEHFEQINLEDRQ